MHSQEENRTAEVESTEAKSREHSGQHHHSHHRRHSKSKLAKFWKKHRQLIKNITMLVLALALVATLAILADLYSKAPADNTQSGDDGTLENAPMMRVEVPYFGKEVSLVTEMAREYMDRDLSEPAIEVIDRLNINNERWDVGLPVRLSLSVGGVPAGCLVVSATVEVSEYPDFSDPALFNIKTGETSVDIPHLKTATKYYYRITYTLSDGTVSALSSSFTTADTPRILSIEGIVNVRDIGGWKTTDGKTVRQGLLYRGSELDGAVEPSYCLTESGRHDMLAVLGIRTDMDLRAPTDNAYGTDALGANVQHIYYGAPDYAYVFAEYGRAVVRQIFSDLADETRYPVYMHCTYGVDRTGTMCYLLEALLGVSEEDLRRDYELSALYNGYLSSEAFEKFIVELKKLEGDTLQQKTENFLLDTGVTEAEIASIREIFWEDK